MYTLVNKQSRILSLSFDTRTRTISHSLALTNPPNFFCAIPGRKMRSNVETCCSRRKAFEALKLWNSEIAQARTKNLESVRKNLTGLQLVFHEGVYLKPVREIIGRGIKLNT